LNADTPKTANVSEKWYSEELHMAQNVVFCLHFKSINKRA